ncbi:MAG: DUF4156 domain-containing protein [Myxococcota bacterium]
MARTASFSETAHLKSGADRVILTRNAAPQSCKHLGQVIGSQGNMLTGTMTSNKKLAEGAMNDTRNKAHALGANYVQLETNQAGMSGEGGTHKGSGGNSFKPPISPISAMPTTAFQRILASNAESRFR